MAVRINCRSFVCFYYTSLYSSCGAVMAGGGRRTRDDAHPRHIGRAGWRYKALLDEWADGGGGGGGRRCTSNERQECFFFSIFLRETHIAERHRRLCPVDEGVEERERGSGSEFPAGRCYLFRKFHYFAPLTCSRARDSSCTAFYWRWIICQARC